MKRILLFAFVLILSVSVIFGQESKSPEAGNAYNKGLDLAKKGDFKSAVPLFEEAIKADEQFAQAYYMLGLSQRRLNDNTAATTSFKKAIEVDAQFESAYIALGNLQTYQEDFSSAINSFNAVLSFNNKSAKAYYGVGNVLYKQKKYEDAISKLALSVQVILIMIQHGMFWACVRRSQTPCRMP